MQLEDVIWCRGPGIDGFYHPGGWPYQEGEGLRLLQEWELLKVFGVAVLEERAG